ncbi:MAG: hypothetical protein QM784_23595 [Polyangiaceae bacterium]
MTKVSMKWIGLAGMVALSMATAAVGCSGSKEESNDATGGTTSEGGNGNGGSSDGTTTGGTAQGGASSSNSSNKGGSSSTSSSTKTPLPEGVTCAAEPAPGNALLSNFSEVTAGKYDPSKNFSWGTSKTLTGGTFFYGDAGDSAASPAVPASSLSAEVADGALHLTGDIQPNKYAGFGFWFGPSCTDARAYKGISFKISGDMSDSELQIQVQSSRNYPIDTKNSKGECEGTWGSPCNSNAYTFKDLVLTAEPQTIQMPWGDFKGGVPIESTRAGGAPWLPMAFQLRGDGV